MLTILCNFKYYVVYILIVMCFLEVFGIELKPGDSCTLETGATGLCKLLTDCPPALKLTAKGILPTELCKSNSPRFIVCCEDTSPVTKAPPTIKPVIPEPAIVTRFVPIGRAAGEVSQKKCKEYAKYVWDRSRSPTLSGVSHVSNTFECPFEKRPLIIGGHLAARQEFPHMALIGYSKGQDIEWGCGGSLISKNYVLTASHCLRLSRMSLAKFVRVGMTNKSDTTNMQTLTVSEVIYHPDYESSSKYHDIALLKLSQNVDLNIYARPACLHTEKEIVTKKGIVTGWGSQEFFGDASNDLFEVVLEFFDHQFCNYTYRQKIRRVGTEIKQGILDDSQICAGSHEDIKDTCRGDSGGPLQIYHPDTDDVKCMYDIVGVTSFGKECGLVNNAPGVYTRVSRYIKWIEDVVWPEET